MTPLQDTHTRVRATLSTGVQPGVHVAFWNRYVDPEEH